jgi:prevent-host-death family protein
LSHDETVRSAGIREARQNLSVLLEQVRKGREVVITDRGRPVARLVPTRQESARPFSSHRRFRARIRLKGKPLSETVADEREDPW